MSIYLSCSQFSSVQQALLAWTVYYTMLPKHINNNQTLKNINEQNKKSDNNKDAM